MPFFNFSGVSETKKKARFSCGVMSLLKSLLNRERISSWVSVSAGSNMKVLPNGEKICSQYYNQFRQLSVPVRTEACALADSSVTMHFN